MVISWTSVGRPFMVEAVMVVSEQCAERLLIARLWQCERPVLCSLGALMAPGAQY